MEPIRVVLTSFFEFIHAWIQGAFPSESISYGLAIIVFTIIVKVILIPLNVKQIMSSVKMQQVQPEISKVQEKYKNDPQKAQQELMKIYKEYKINPMGGCLPLLVQWPILIALYSVYSRLEGISGVTFLWITDLSKPDVFLAVISFITTYAQSAVLAPKSGPQAKQMQMTTIVMSVVMGFMCMQVPAALGIYWVVSNIIGGLQTVLTRKFTPKIELPDAAIAVDDNGKQIKASQNKGINKKK
jgi:YidC/Oxa1 family membrane protein insertase